MYNVLNSIFYVSINRRNQLTAFYLFRGYRLLSDEQFLCSATCFGKSTVPVMRDLFFLLLRTAFSFPVRRRHGNLLIGKHLGKEYYLKVTFSNVHGAPTNSVGNGYDCWAVKNVLVFFSRFVNSQ